VNCGKRFMHSRITESDAGSYYLPNKPAFPPTLYKCPHCNRENTYQRTDLIYQTDNGPC
jgi:hypothetical protein